MNLPELKNKSKQSLKKIKLIGMSRGITKRWTLNTFLLVFAVVVALEIGFGVFIQSYYYDGIRQGLLQRVGETARFFTSVVGTSKDMQSAASSFVENTEDLEKFELQFINKEGKIIVSSTGFSFSENHVMPDYDEALSSVNGIGSWNGKNEGNENILAVTRLLPSDDGYNGAAVRLVVSLEPADRQIFLAQSLMILIGLIFIVIVIMCGAYFINSIVNPVREITRSAKKIAQGDFSVMLEKKHDDEIGDLCETINDMANELAASEKMKNEFISSVSHELRTPLTAIKGWGETLRSGGESLDRNMYDKGIGVIIKEAERLSGLVEDLLDFSRVLNKRMSMRTEKMDLLAELGEAVYLYDERAKQEGKFLLYSEPDSISPIVGDPNRIRQVFVNLIDNAIKYTDEGDTVTVTAVESNGYAMIIVSDTGCGIPANELPRIKEKFYKANTTRRGFGIGLGIADEIVQMHSGTLDIKSEENIGTTVTVTLPVMPPQRAEETQAQSESEDENGTEKQ